ncbi:MAG: MopE-related protein [Nanoarchaeota archaeon]
MNKKGVSGVLVVVLIILLVLAAIVIIWAFLRYFIADSSETIQIETELIRLNYKIKTPSLAQQDINFVLERRPGGEQEAKCVIIVIEDNNKNTESFIREISIKELERIQLQATSTFASIKKLSVYSCKKDSKGKIVSSRYPADVFQLQVNMQSQPSCTQSSDCTAIECQTALCASGVCVYADQPDGTSCTSGTCQVGVCAPPSPCALTSASWSTPNAVNGQQVNMNVVGTGSCAGKTITFNVYEDDVLSNVLSGTVSGTYPSAVWTAQWIDDGSGQGDPEYFFEAFLVSNPSQTISSGTTTIDELVVSQATSADVCGDGQRTGVEVCDIGPDLISANTDDDLNGQTCISQGFASGNLGCSFDCLSFDTNACVPFCTDLDGDLYGTGITLNCLRAGVDCNDNDANIHPFATELCNTVDDDCDGTIDEGCPGCTDDCAPSGAKQCSGTSSYQTCGNYDADTCLEWSTTTCNTAIGETCLSGECVIGIAACGATLDRTNQKYILTQDITFNPSSPPPQCILITADGVTLNGNNKMINYPPTSTSYVTHGVVGASPSGILNGITIENLVINTFGFKIGIYLEGCNNNIIQNNQIRSSIDGGIYFISSTGCNNNKIIGNRADSSVVGSGIVLDTASDNFIENNNVETNRRGGIELISDSINNNFRNNYVCSNTFGDFRCDAFSDTNNYNGNTFGNDAFYVPGSAASATCNIPDITNTRPCP